MLTKVVGAMHHIILLPGDRSEVELRQLARRQAAANKLPACLVIESDWVLYLNPDSGETQSTELPETDIFIFEKLRAVEDFAQTEELHQRKSQLKIFTETTGPQSGYLMGDLTKGGRPASAEELLRLKGRPENGIPKGLKQCPKCCEWRGECLDPSPEFKDKLMRVYCLCETKSIPYIFLLYEFSYYKEILW